MSTNAIIFVEDFEGVAVYKHWDGYPEATLKWLEDFNKDFIKRRGVDPQYEFAQLLRSSARDAEKYNLDDSRHTGWGVIKISLYYAKRDYEGSDNYVYLLKKDGTVEVC